MKGISIDELLDERVRPAAQANPAPFVADLLSRLPYLVPGRQRAGYPAVFVEVGEPGHPDAELIACALQAQATRSFALPAPCSLRNSSSWRSASAPA